MPFLSRRAKVKLTEQVEETMNMNKGTVVTCEALANFQSKVEAKGAGLMHGSAGRVSNRAKPRSLRRTVWGLMGEKYGGEPGERFEPTLAVEHLGKEDGIRLGVERLRKWMLEEGLWRRERRRPAQRRRGERKAHLGKLVQLDGSFHDWLEGRGRRGCLMNRVDEATGTTLCRMAEEETIWAAVGVVRAWIECNGVPQALHGLEERVCAGAQRE